MLNTNQPNFTIKPDTQALPPTDFDNLAPEELRRLINEAKRVKTGKAGNIPPPTPPPAPPKYIDYSQRLGGLYE